LKTFNDLVFFSDFPEKGPKNPGFFNVFRQDLTKAQKLEKLLTFDTFPPNTSKNPRET
jgi:hypothetical protein